MTVQAITTRFIAPTNTRGSRVKATAAAGSITIAWQDRLNPMQNHCAAAEALARRLEWSGIYIPGGMPDGAGYCFVHVPNAVDFVDGFELAAA
jgi:hypothetical protein